jgi:SAM-dependent methyltransferase
MDLRADRAYLTSTAYADDRLLQDRVSLYEHQTPRTDLVVEVLERLGDLAGKSVLDVGCGYGAYVGALVGRGARVVGIDLSAGMLASMAAAATGRVVADAQALPVADRSVDAVLAMHMLYHVPEPVRAIREARRVLAPGGRLVAAVGGPRQFAEATAIRQRLLDEAGLDAGRRDLGLTNTRLPAALLGELVEQEFGAVEPSSLASTVVLGEAGPLVRYTASTTAAKLSAASGVDLLGRFAVAIDEVIAERGEFVLTTEVAVFVARS